MAPPRKKLNKDQTAELELLAQYLPRELIAGHFGIGRSTLQLIFERQPKVYEAYRRGRARTNVAISQKLIKKALKGDNACMMFYLKAFAGMRETQHVDHSSTDGTMAAPTTILVQGPDGDGDS